MFLSKPEFFTDSLDKNFGRQRLQPRNRVKSGSENEDSTDSDWETWVGTHAPRFLLYARQLVRCEADAHDLVQEAVVESWGRQPNGSPPPLALVFATIRRRAIDLARSDDRRTDRESRVAEDTSFVWFDSGVEDRERNHLLQKAMSSLLDIYREVVILKVWGELTFAEIAEALDIPANTAASRYRYGLEELRKLTKENFP
jgi:RNA polymerase sigma-70 factor, ECF subfamily